MPSRSDLVTSSRFERRLSGGRHDNVFKTAFGPHPDGPAARFFRVSRMTVWRWRHDRAPLPKLVADILSDLVQEKVKQAHLAQAELGYFLREPSKPRRPLSGCCAGYVRKAEIPRLY
jgi:hypothetical protein